METRTVILGMVVILAAASGAHAGGDRGISAGAAFARLAALAGEWKSADGKAALSYEVIAGGTAIIERESGEGRPPMLTLYHRDGERLLLTHYCMAGNQPRMVARTFNATAGELVFDFLDATNLPNPDAGHMHSVTIRFLDGDRIESEWQFYENGEPKMTERAAYARVR